MGQSPASPAPSPQPSGGPGLSWRPRGGSPVPGRCSPASPFCLSLVVATGWVCRSWHDLFHPRKMERTCSRAFPRPKCAPRERKFEGWRKIEVGGEEYFNLDPYWSDIPQALTFHLTRRYFLFYVCVFFPILFSFLLFYNRCKLCSTGCLLVCL